MEYRFKSIGKNVTIYPGAKIVGVEHIEIGSNVIIDDFVFIVAAKKTIIGNYVHIASFTSITGGGECILEDFSTLSSGVRIFTGTEDFAGSGLVNSTIPSKYRSVVRSKVIVKKHAIIGGNSTILPGVVVGEGGIVGAGSIVTGNIDPWTLNVGAPARKIKVRPSTKILSMEKQLFEEYGLPEKLYQGFE